MITLAALLLLAAPPETAKRPVVDEYHGEKVVDEYRWLEDGKSDEVRTWSKAQDTEARAHFKSIPGRAELGERIRELATSTSARHFAIEKRGAVYFALKFQPPKQQVFLVTLKSPDDLKSERALVDPNVIDPTGKTAIDFYVPSPDGKLVAVSLSKNGTEDGTVHVYDLKTRKALPDRVERVNGGTAGGSLTWNANGTGFWYSRYPRAGERAEADLPFYQQVYFHTLGGKEDRYEIGKDFAEPKIAQNVLETSPDGKWVADRVARGDGGEFEWWLKNPAGEWKRFASFSDKVVKGRFGYDGALWLLSRKDAPKGKVLRLVLGDEASLEKATLVVPEAADASIETIEVTATRLYTADLMGGPSRVRAFAHDGKALGELPLLEVSTVSDIVRVGGDELLFDNQSFLEPAAWWRVGADGKPKRTKLATTSPVDFSDVEVVRELAVSKDGTKVPVSILKPKGMPMDGSRPAILWGYGGYGISIKPGFSPMRKAWLEQGGVFALANLRGGGEYGEEWHLAGNLANKQNVFDDFIAVAEHMIAKKYTSKERLCIMGGSNGGLLMGAVLTQRPDLAAAVAAAVGVFDMLRVELHPNGAFNVTEFGTVTDPKLYKAMRAYSPVHAVKEGVAYPAVMLTAGTNDPRVDAYHARKMAAELQAATSSGKPVVLRVSEGGHGGSTGLDEKIEEMSDTYAFLLHHAGAKYQPPRTKKKPLKKPGT